MTRFVFPLEAVLRLKQRRELLAEIKLKQSAAVLRVAQGEVETLVEQLNQVCENLRGKVGKVQDAAAWLQIYQRSAALEQGLKTAQQRTAAAAHVHVRAAEARRQAAVEVQVLQTLRERQWQEFRTARQRAEQRQLDDAVLRRWQPAQDARGWSDDQRGALA